MTARQMIELLLDDQVRVSADARALLKGGGFFEWKANDSASYLIGLTDTEATDPRALVTAIHESVHASRCLAGAAPYQLEMHELKLWARFKEEILVHWGTQKLVRALRRHGRVSRSVEWFNYGFSLWALAGSCPLVYVPLMVISVLVTMALLRCPLTRSAWTAYCGRKYATVAAAMAQDPAYAPLLAMTGAASE